MARPPRWIYVVVVVFTTLLLTVGWYVVQRSLDRARKATERELSAVIHEKATLIDAWRSERLGDARVLQEDDLLRELIRTWLAEGDIATAARLRNRFQSLARNYDYENVLLLTRAGEVLFYLRQPALEIGGYADSLGRLFLLNEPGFTELHGFSTDEPHVGVIVPFPGLGDPPRSDVAIILQSSAETFLYEVLKGWPVPSVTSEILMVRQKADSVQFISELRFLERGRSDLITRPVGLGDLPAARGVQGEEGFMVGRDYNGVPVFAVTRSVPGSQWHLVAKISQAEAFEDVRREIGYLIAGLVVVMLLTVVSATLVWRQRSAVTLRRLLVLEKERGRLQQRFKLVLERAPIALILASREGGTRFVNDRFHELYGYTREDIPTVEAWWERAYPDPIQRDDARNLWREHIAISTASGSDIDLGQREIRTKQGDTRLVEIKSVLLDDGMVIAFLDVTRREQSIADLRESEAKFRTIFDRSALAKLLTAPDGTLLKVNQAFADLVGYTIDELHNISFASITHPADIASSRDLIRRLIVGEQNHDQIEKRYIHRDGRIVWTSLSTHLLRDDDGAPLYFITSVLDITAEHDAREALRESEARFRMLAEWIDAAFWLTGSDGETLHYVSPAFDRLWGIDRAELMGRARGRFEFVHPDDLERVEKAYTRVVEPGGYDVEYRITTPQGEERWIHDRAFPILASNGSVARIAGLAEDITSRVRSGEELNVLNETLARSNAELEQFAYVASHDLQEPLRMVASFTQLLKERYEGRLDEQADRYIDFAVDGAIRMQRLIHGLLELSRVGTRGRNAESVDLNTVVATVRHDLHAQISDNEVELEVASLPTVQADPGQMTQVFQNLIGNAIKFRGEDPPRIVVGAERSEDGWTISVADNGIGIAPEFRDTVFQIFRRLHGRDRYAGNGIGLSIVKKIVERHGGTVSVDLAHRPGTRFQFTLPDTLPSALREDAS